MPKKLDFEISKTELSQVTEAIHKDKRPEVRQRATAVRMLALGQKPTDVAQSLGVQPPTMSVYPPLPKRASPLRFWPTKHGTIDLAI
jgi:hypothetical protein